MNRVLDPDFPAFELQEGRGDEPYSLMTEMQPNTDNTGRLYTMVTQALENDDFYQGLNKITVIKRVSDGKLFGYSWWEDNSKHGESFVDPNGDEFNLECDSGADDFDWDDFISYYVFEPVEEYPIIAYRKLT